MHQNFGFSIKRIIRKLREGESVIENGKFLESKVNIKTFALLDQEHKSSNWLQCRTRQQPIRTISIIPFRNDPEKIYCRENCAWIHRSKNSRLANLNRRLKKESKKECPVA